MMSSEIHRWGRLLAGLGIAVCVVILVVSAVAVRPLHTYELVSLCVLASLLVGGGIVAVLVALAAEREQAAELALPVPEPEPLAVKPVEPETAVLSSAPRTGPRERPAGPPPGYPPRRVTFQPGQGPGAMAAYLGRLDRIIDKIAAETWARGDSQQAVLEGLIMARRAAQETSRGLVAARQPGAKLSAGQPPDGGTRP